MNADIQNRLLEGLNTEQRAAVTHDMSPLLIVAGAGTGKTTTLANRVAWLIASGVDARRILLLTFSRRASREMLRRVDSILKSCGADPFSGKQFGIIQKVWGGTFHAVAARLLRKHGKRIGLSSDFTILDRSDSEDLMGLVRTELKLNQTAKKFPLKSTCLDIYSRSVNSQMKLALTLEQHYPWCQPFEEQLSALFTGYVDRKQKQAVLDYDDLLLFWYTLAETEETALGLREQFDCILVDEYQDTNVVQAGILRNMSPTGSGVTVVGDDAQSIYSFRAADVRNILDFPQQLAGTTILSLQQNYRSTQPILDTSNQLIAQAGERFEKNLWSEKEQGEKPILVTCQDEDEQAEFIIDTILAKREDGIPLSDQAILFRAAQHSMLLEIELVRRGVPFHKYGGLKFIETAHIKDLLAFFRLVENPLDVVSGIRVLTLLPGIGPKRATNVMEELVTWNGQLSAWRSMKVPAKTQAIWGDFVKLLMELTREGNSAQSMATQVNRVREFYSPLLEEKYDHTQPRLRDLQQLESIAGRYKSRAEFLTEVTLDPPSSTQDLADGSQTDDDALVLSTIHSAKGLEWNSVYVIHAADGQIPSDNATGSKEEIDEERRLMYVAMTRAKRALFVCHPIRQYYRRSRGDRHSFTQLSRFLDETVVASMQRIHATEQQLSDDTAADSQSTIGTADIRDRIKSMWN